MDIVDFSPLRSNWDELKFPLKADKNPGDALHRASLQGLLWGMQFAKGSKLWIQARSILHEQYSRLYLGNGIYQRYYRKTKNPFSGEIYTQHLGRNVMSRDQMIPTVMCWHLFDMQDRLIEFREALASRSGRFTNTIVHGKPNAIGVADIATWSFYALMDRCQGRSGTEMIIKGDSEELAGTHLICATTSPPKIWIPWPVKKWHYPLGGPKLHGDPINKTIVLIFNKFTGTETRDAQLARQIYAKKGRVWESWLGYWERGPTDPQCPFHVPFKPYIDALGSNILA